MNSGRKSSGGSRKHGRNKVKCARYRARRRRLTNKLKRIRQSNGEKAAAEYRRKYS